jgi:putative iron-dependent peroxidase
LCEDKVASFDRLVAGKAGFEQRRVRRFAVFELSKPPATGRDIFFRVFDHKLNVRGGSGHERLGTAKDFVVFLGRDITPGEACDVRAKRMDLCFELATQLMARLGNAVLPVDEVQGFRYFDDRDLLGFVDGTENPRGAAVADAVLIGDEDTEFAGGTYVIVQKYLHDLGAWNALSTEAQERIIGRTKLSDIELDDSVKPTSAHNALTTIVENGKEVKILRDNMPFGRPAHGEFGTYFIGYSRSPRTIEQMLENMFIGRPPGNYDRLLDFSRAVTGNLFFVPSATFLENVAEDQAVEGQTVAAEFSAAPAVAETSLSIPSVREGSLGIGSLKGDTRHE